MIKNGFDIILNGIPQHIKNFVKTWLHRYALVLSILAIDLNFDVTFICINDVFCFFLGWSLSDIRWLRSFVGLSGLILEEKYFLHHPKLWNMKVLDVQPSYVLF